MALHRSLSFSGVLFDFDGTLLNNEPIHQLAIRTVFEQFTSQPLSEEESRSLAGLTYHDRLVLLFERRGIVDDSAVLRLEEEAREIMKEHEAHDDITVPGAREFVESLSEYGVEMAVVSSATAQRIDALLTVAHIREYFSLITGCEAVTALKPDPAPYLYTLEALELAPSATVVFEDSPNGVAAACGAGLRVIGLTTTFGAAELRGTLTTIPDYSTFTVNDLHVLMQGAY